MNEEFKKYIFFLKNVMGKAFKQVTIRPGKMEEK